MNAEKAQQVWNYLEKTKQGFCFVESLGRIVDIDECKKVLSDFWKCEALPF